MADHGRAAPESGTAGSPPTRARALSPADRKTRAKRLGHRHDDGQLRRGRQAIRDLKILAALSAARGGLTAQELLEAVGDECSLRTIYRSLEQMEAAGFGPTADADGHRFSLTENAPRWTLPVDTPELLALLLAEQVLGPLLGTEIAAPLVSLRNKVMAALTPNGRAFCEELAATSAATSVGPAEHSGQEGIVATLREAIVMQQVVRIEYAAPNRPPATREIEPHATWYAQGRLYAIALCRRAKALRTFAVTRIKSAEILDDTFAVEPGFSLDEFVERGFGVYHGEIHRVAIELGPEVAHLAKERVFHRSQTVEELDGGRARLTFQVAGLPEIAAWVAGFGAKARALEPPELVAQVREIHAGGVRVHGGG